MYRNRWFVESCIGVAKMVRGEVKLLSRSYNENISGLGVEIGIDEAGRGPMMGRVYAGAVVIPEGFDISKIRDSKKYSSKKMIDEVYEAIKANCPWGVGFATEEEIDKMNILQATHLAMHRAINNLIDEFPDIKPMLLLVDGNSFKSFARPRKGRYMVIPHKCIEEGDNTFASIAAASIIAKVSRDAYIDELCDDNPYLDKWDIRNNKGYGTKKHMTAIRTIGISPFHRTTFGACKSATVIYE